jgi:hypothetical protein
MPANILSADSHAWERFPEPKDLQSLAALLKPDANAVSFCYSLHSFPDRSHHTEAVAIGKLVQDERAKFTSGAVPMTLSNDLDGILAIAEEIQRTPTRWRALYACAEQNVLNEFDLPAPESAAQLKVAGHFFLEPLVEALQSCRKYRVVLIESGKARLFEVRGTDIEEVAHSLPENDLTQRSEDSRVGWSKHIDRNIEHQERAWFRLLVDELGKLPGALIVGCRDDLWGELRPYFAELDNDVMGSFHLPSFEVGADEVLKQARQVFDQYKLERCKKLLHAIEEDHEHGVRGLSEVLNCLAAGRVHTLLIGEMLGQIVAECARCGHVQQQTAVNCASCDSSMLVPIPAVEALIRAALIQKAEILIYPHGETMPFPGVAALLRY